VSRFIVVCDVDSTLINDVVIDTLTETADKAKESARINVNLSRGKTDFAEAVALKVALLKDQPAALIETVLGQITPTNGAAALVESVHDAGGFIVATSDGFNEFVGPIAKQLGLDAWIANGLEVLDGTLTGRMYGPTIDGAAKVKFLESYAKTKRIPLERTVSVSSGIADRDLMAVAGLSVAFCAHPTIRDSAHVRIDERDLALVASLFGKRAGQSLG
jgi:phosphoserine phosphatase